MQIGSSLRFKYRGKAVNYALYYTDRVVIARFGNFRVEATRFGWDPTQSTRFILWILIGSLAQRESINFALSQRE